MVVIKLNECTLTSIPETCLRCPFVQSYPELDYGECTGYDNYTCGITGTDIGSSYEPLDRKPYNCPLISIEEL